MPPVDDFEPEDTFDGPCLHCSCCPEFCCYCDALKPEADPESPFFEAGADCDVAYDTWCLDAVMMPPEEFREKYPDTEIL